MSKKRIGRREFMSDSAVLAAGLAAGFGDAEAADAKKGKAFRDPKAVEPNKKKILNFNENMEYRRLGKTNLMVSAVCLGGHWKRVQVMLTGRFTGEGYSEADKQNVNNTEFLKNRADVVSRCIDVGINYIDACTPPEVLAYSKVLKGRRDKIYLGYSWYEKEPRVPEWRAAKKLIQGLDESLREAGLDYVDLWRITLPQERFTDLDEMMALEHGATEALEMAKKQGKVRFTGVSTHNRMWLKVMIEEYSQQLDVVLFPYTASSKVLPDDSLFDTVKKYDVGVFGIKPFADNALFEGDSSPNNLHAAEDARRARLAVRYILSNPAITAPIPGLTNIAQVDNVAKAVMEHRKLDAKERADLTKATDQMWARLPEHYQWLKNWEYV